MNSSLSLIPSLDRFASTSSSPSKKDYTYAEQYPIFISQEKLSKLIGSSAKSSKLPFIGSEIKPVKDPNPLPLIPKHPKSDSIDFKYSKFPSSSLNVELEKQCLLAELYQNIDKIKYKEKSFPPIKVVWQRDRSKKKVKVNTAKVNMKNVIHGVNFNLICDNCGNSKCMCRVTDSFCDKTWEDVKHKYAHRKDIYHGVVRSKLYGRTAKFQSFSLEPNYYAERIEMKRTRRRRPAYNTFENFQKDILQVSPKNIYMKVLEDEDNNEI